MVVEDLQTISEVMSDFNKLHPKHVFNLLNTSGVLRDNYRFSIMEAVIEVCSFNHFVELVEEREDDWDEDIYLYEGYDWYDFGEMICENCGYQVPDALEPHIDYASFGETFKYNAFEIKKQLKPLIYKGLSLAEKERFELSRRVYPAYTLSRGASSAS